MRIFFPLSTTVISQSNLELNNLSAKDEEGEYLFKNLSFSVSRGDKIAFISEKNQAITTLFEILNGKTNEYSGSFKFGTTIRHTYLPNNHDEYFLNKISIMDWLRDFSEEKDDIYIRGFLGKMLFSGEEVLKSTQVLSGGEKVRCMLSKMMLLEGNVLIFDTPTNHLDLESIQALNNSMANFAGTILFSSHDHALTQSVANRIIEISPTNNYDKLMNYQEFIEYKQELKNTSV